MPYGPLRLGYFPQEALHYLKADYLSKLTDPLFCWKHLQRALEYPIPFDLDVNYLAILKGLGISPYDNEYSYAYHKFSKMAFWESLTLPWLLLIVREGSQELLKTLHKRASFSIPLRQLEELQETFAWNPKVLELLLGTPKDEKERDKALIRLFYYQVQKLPSHKDPRADQRLSARALSQLFPGPYFFDDLLFEIRTNPRDFPSSFVKILVEEGLGSPFSQGAALGALARMNDKNALNYLFRTFIYSQETLEIVIKKIILRGKSRERPFLRTFLGILSACRGPLIVQDHSLYLSLGLQGDPQDLEALFEFNLTSIDSSDKTYEIFLDWDLRGVPFIKYYDVLLRRGKVDLWTNRLVRLFEKLLTAI